MVEVETVEVEHKYTNETKFLKPKIFIEELQNFSKLDLFCDVIAFEYDFICKDEKNIDNEHLIILCGHKNYECPYCIEVILKLNRDMCKSLADLEEVLIEK